MTCGSCGAPIVRGLTRCPFCGASAKYAMTESGALPYEVAAQGSREQKEELEPPEPRWDLEGPQGNVHSYRRAMRGIHERWASLERRRRVSRSSLGCLTFGVFFVLFTVSCTIFSLVESQALMRSQAQEPSTSEITATALANPNPYFPGKGLLTVNEPLGDNSTSAWTDYSADPRPPNQGCDFQDGSYDTSKPDSNTPSIKYCLANRTQFRNFAYQIEMINHQGEDGGLVFRANSQDEYYYFYISINGFYALWLNSGAQGKILARGSSQYIRQGNGQANILAIVADGPTIDLYVNHASLATVHDGTYSVGKIGTAVGAPDKIATEREFDNAKVWTW